MVDESQVSGYLPVLQMWGREQFLRLIQAAANADDKCKEKAFQDLARHSASYVAIMQGVELLKDERPNLAMDFEGHVEVAVDILQRVLAVDTLTAESRNAIACWLADVRETMHQGIEDAHAAG